MSQRARRKQEREGVAAFDQMLAETMRRRRQKQGLTAEQVAAELGLTEADFAEAERWAAEHREELEEQEPAAIGRKQR